MGAPLGEDAGDSSSQPLDRAKPITAGGVVYCGAALAILLVVEPQGYRRRSGQLGKWCGVGDDNTVSAPKGDVLYPKLYRTSADVSFRHSVLADSKKEKEGSGNKVSCGACEISVRPSVVRTCSLNCRHRDR